MSSYGECQPTDIAATPLACFDALRHFEALPQ
jgi:hypothetical protein